jgi:hypothetical protein
MGNHGFSDFEYRNNRNKTSQQSLLTGGNYDGNEYIGRIRTLSLFSFRLVRSG